MADKNIAKEWAWIKQKNLKGCSSVCLMLLLVSKRSEMPWRHLKVQFSILSFDMQWERGAESPIRNTSHKNRSKIQFKSSNFQRVNKLSDSQTLQASRVLVKQRAISNTSTALLVFLQMLPSLIREPLWIWCIWLEISLNSKSKQVSSYGYHLFLSGIYFLPHYNKCQVPARDSKIRFPTPTKTGAHPEALTEAVRRAMERQPRRSCKNAQSHNQVHVTPFQLQRDTKATCSISITKYTHKALLNMVHYTFNDNNWSWMNVFI